MILWQEGVFLGSALSSLSPPLHFPEEQDGRDPSRLNNFYSFARFRIQWSSEDEEMWIFYVQVRQVVTTAMVVSATRGQIHLFTKNPKDKIQGCISCLTCSYPELTEDHVLTSAYVKIFRNVTRNAVNKSVWRKKDCFWLPLNKHAMNIW